MDLHLIPGAEPSESERAAVDAALGPPASGWEGGERRSDIDGHIAMGGDALRARRHQLLPALWAAHGRAGWISPGALNYICQRLSVAPAEAWGVATFYAMFSVKPQPSTIAHVCDDIACHLSGAEGLLAEAKSRMGEEAVRRSPCLGLCERAPAVLMQNSGVAVKDYAIAPCAAGDLGMGPPHPVPIPPAVAGVAYDRGSASGGRLPPGEGTPQDPLAPRRGDPTNEGRPPALGNDGRSPAVSVGVRGGRISPGSASAPQTLDDARHAKLRLLRRVGRVDPGSLDDYRAQGGYAALERAFVLGPEGVVREALESKLVGRGGAAFPAGRKWDAVAKQPAKPHFLVCNADESEPGTFKDRVILEEDPFAVVEAMTIVAHATGCEHGYVYIRGEYPLAIERVEAAIAAARAAGLLGASVAGRAFAFDLEVRRGAGAYICGEETALFNSIEGFRGEPRNKPPFPVEKGLFGKPTVINNVETLACVPQIVLEGGAAFAAIGSGQSTGPKLFCLSGHLARPGVYEVEFGATLRQLLEEAGGVPGGRAIRAILLGGAAGSFVGPEALDTPLTFEGTRAIAASLGSGVIMVFDESANLSDAVRRIAAFFRDESCGQCVPCRIGTQRQEELVTRIASGRPLGSMAQEIALLDDMARAMKDASICGLGQTASGAIQSAIAKLGVFAGAKP